MILSDKYKLEEDNLNIKLYEKKRVELRHPETKQPTGKFEDKWSTVPVGYYPVSTKGRVNIYHKMCNLEISKMEEQGLQDILDKVTEVGEGILDFFKEQESLKKDL